MLHKLRKKKSVTQVTICANMKGMEIKPGSLGKAVPPYDVQVCWYITPELSCSCGYRSRECSLSLLCPALYCNRLFTELIKAIMTHPFCRS